MEDSIKMWEKGWAHHGKAYEADAYETEEEDNGPPESTERPEGLGAGGPGDDHDRNMDQGPPEPPMVVSPVS